MLGAAALGGLVLAVAVTPASARIRVTLGSTSAVGAIVETEDQLAHRVILEPFSEGNRHGWRFRQQQFGDPAFVSSDCTVNVFVNDVVCETVRVGGSILMGSGDDSVIVRETMAGITPGAFGPSCIPQSVLADGSLPPPSDAARVLVTLNDGDDRMSYDASSPCPGGSTAGAFFQQGQSLAVLGGDGEDVIAASPYDDNLDGGPDDDDLQGRAGNDRLRPDAGLDRVDGGPGDDVMFLSQGPDDFIGGDGLDTVSYDLGEAVSVTIDDVANDGRPSEGDNVRTTVENVVGGSGPDTITGSDGPNVLDGGRFGQRDVLDGRGGADTLIGGPGDDLVIARDGVKDTAIDCGPGTADALVADLKDQKIFTKSFSPVVEAGCETVSFFAADDGPPGRLTARRARIGADGTVRLPVTCPRDARVDCRGTVKLLVPGRRAFGSDAYRVRRGSSGVARVNVPESLRGRTVVAVTTERGLSRKGPRSSAQAVRLR